MALALIAMSLALIAMALALIAMALALIAMALALIAYLSYNKTAKLWTKWANDRQTLCTLLRKTLKHFGSIDKQVEQNLWGSQNATQVNTSFVFDDATRKLTSQSSSMEKYLTSIPTVAVSQLLLAFSISTVPFSRVWF